MSAVFAFGCVCARRQEGLSPKLSLNISHKQWLQQSLSGGVVSAGGSSRTGRGLAASDALSQCYAISRFLQHLFWFTLLIL